MLHLWYLSATVNVIDGVPNDRERQHTQNDKWNPKPDADELLHHKQGDGGNAEDHGTSPEVQQTKPPVLLQLFEFGIVWHGHAQAANCSSTACCGLAPRQDGSWPESTGASLKWANCYRTNE